MTKFEIVNQWNRLQKDFCQIEPLAGAYLDGTVLQRGDFSTNPFPIKLVFRADNAFNHTQFTKNPLYPAGLLEYLETILQTKIDLSFELPSMPAGSAASQASTRPAFKSTPAASFERDKEREPILAFLAETFETTWQGTRSLAQTMRNSLQEPSSESEE